MALNLGEDYVAKIRRLFGLNLYEAKVWLALLSQGKSTTGRLSEIANIPKSRSYDILASLEGAGFIVRDVGKPIAYRAIAPSELIEKLEEKAKEDLDIKLDKLSKLKGSSVLKDLQELYSRGIKYVKEEHVVTSYQGMNSAMFRIKKSIKEAKDEVLLVTTANALSSKLRALNRALKHAKSKGVAIHVMAPIENLTEEISSDIKQIGKFNKLNLDIGRFIIVDKNEVFVFTQNEKETHPSSEVVINIKGPYIAEKFKNIAAAHTHQG